MLTKHREYKVGDVLEVQDVEAIALLNAKKARNYTVIDSGEKPSEYREKTPLKDRLTINTRKKTKEMLASKKLSYVTK